jgi:LPS sulfotransferase NodH
MRRKVLNLQGSLRQFMSSLRGSSTDRVDALRRVFPDHERVSRTSLSKLIGGRSRTREPAGGRAYLLCMTPRSGSSFLSDILGQTGSVGIAKEHFPTSPEDPLPSWLAQCGSLEDAFRILQEDAPSGYFGIKGGLFQMFPLISEGVFAGPNSIFKHLYLTRRDRVGQAISLARAVKTNEWHSSDAPAPDPDLSFEDVLFYLRYIRSMAADWETVFSALQINPLHLYYEDLITDPSGTFERIRQHLDVQWKISPADVVSVHQSLSQRHDPGWKQKLRDQFASFDESGIQDRQSELAQD